MTEPTVQEKLQALRESRFFIGDNGRCTCWKHSGASIRATGRDISGGQALCLTAGQVSELGLKCEDCK